MNRSIPLLRSTTTYHCVPRGIVFVPQPAFPLSPLTTTAALSLHFLDRQELNKARWSARRVCLRAEYLGPSPTRTTRNRLRWVMSALASATYQAGEITTAAGAAMTS